MRPEAAPPALSASFAASVLPGLVPTFSTRVASWQQSHGRDGLPWQNTRDPYRVWLSEIMLQQTQVATVRDYFERFIARFPDVAALAAAPEDEVMGLWSGLGYYSRARNMHRCAQEVVLRFDGVFPAAAAQLISLPGIGKSTAAAIAAFCFGERVAILDGNVKRVLTRVLGVSADLAVAANERALWQNATDLLPPEDDPERIARYTQGLMDLGATVCLPRRPACLLCPVADSCRARIEGAPERYPVKTRKLRRSAESWWLLQASDSRGRIWLEKRPSRGIWAGLYAMPVYADRAALLEALPSRLRDAAQDGAVFKHVLTHKDLHLHPVRVEFGKARSLTPSGQWFGQSQWSSLGLPAPVRRLLEQSS